MIIDQKSLEVRKSLSCVQHKSVA